MPLGVATTAKLILLLFMGFKLSQADLLKLNFYVELVESLDRVIPPIAYKLPSKPRQQPRSNLG